MTKTTFLEVYQKNIAPKLEKIDLFLKTEPEHLNIHTTASLLYISEEEVNEIMKREKISSINPATFFMIMYHGSSELCKLLKREWERKSPVEYSIEDISYIYNLPPHKVYSAVDTLGIENITSETIYELFSCIHLDILQ
ncbi:MAG: hypothetical protein GX347_03135 [Epulopiscium sp.]|nr:hypothetical protein [Candidatus Epulonipiscium sp.]